MIIGLNLAKDSDTTFWIALCKRWQYKYASESYNFINLLDLTTGPI